MCIDNEDRNRIGEVLCCEPSWRSRTGPTHAPRKEIFLAAPACGRPRNDVAHGARRAKSEPEAMW